MTSSKFFKGSSSTFGFSLTITGEGYFTESTLHATDDVVAVPIPIRSSMILI
jgi:hypothetical protein